MDPKKKKSTVQKSDCKQDNQRSIFAVPLFNVGFITMSVNCESYRLKNVN